MKNLFTVIVMLIMISVMISPVYAQSPEFALKCYLFTATPAVNPGSTPFQDQFQNDNVNPDVDQRYCVEALKHSTTPPLNPRYWVEHEDEPDSLLNPNGVVITDQFLGTFTANLFHFETLVPAAVAGLVPGPVNNQAYSGYSPSVIPPTNPPNTAIQVTDQFGTSLIILDSLFAFEATAFVGPQGSLVGQDLTCYMFLDENPVIDPDAAMSASTWVTQFVPGGASVTDLDPADVLCVMAEKMSPSPRPGGGVGGEYSTLDSTALLVAGLQTNLAWIIPVAVSTVGIGAFLLRKKF